MGNQRIRVDMSDPGRLWGQVARRIVTGPKCWSWAGAHGTKGYPIVSVRVLGQRRSHQNVPVHRLLYLLAHPETDLDAEIHHQCHHQWCVNPFCVEDKTVSEHRKEHPRRVQNPQRERCHRDHPLSGDNLIVTASGKRRCRTCANDRNRRYRRAKSTFARGEHKTHCKYGHDWIPENIYTRPSGHRECRLCIKERFSRG